MSRREKLAITLALLAYLLGLSGYVVYRYFRERDMQLAYLDDRLRVAANVARDAIGRDFHDDIAGIKDLSRERQVAISDTLNQVVESMDIKFVYSFVEVDGSFYFASDSDVDETKKNGIWKEYPEVTEPFRAAFEASQTFVEEVTDRWGSFRSIAVPFKNANGQTYMMGADVTMATVISKAREAAFQAFAEALYFMALLVPLALSYISHLRQQNKRLESMVAERTQRISSLIDQTKRYLPPQLYTEIVGGHNVAVQRRVKLTVFFSDVKDFTAITEQMEAETLARLLNTYLSEMSKIALKYGGTIDKYVGDAMMVFFGAPEFVSDQHHAQQCARMAVEMREKLKELRADWADIGVVRSFHVRMGISTGYCTVGSFGSEFKMDYTAIGTFVNLAARLQSVSEPDRILISEETRLHCRGIAEVIERDKIHLKGIAEAVTCFELVGIAGDEAVTHLKQTEAGFELRTIAWRSDAYPREKDRIVRDLREALALAEGEIDTGSASQAA